MLSAASGNGASPHFRGGSRRKPGEGLEEPADLGRTLIGPLTWAKSVLVGLGAFDVPHQAGRMRPFGADQKGNKDSNRALFGQWAANVVPRKDTKKRDTLLIGSKK